MTITLSEIAYSFNIFLDKSAYYYIAIFLSLLVGLRFSIKAFKVSNIVVLLITDIMIVLIGLLWILYITLRFYFLWDIELWFAITFLMVGLLILGSKALINDILDKPVAGFLYSVCKAGIIVMRNKTNILFLLLSLFIVSCAALLIMEIPCLIPFLLAPLIQLLVLLVSVKSIPGIRLNALMIGLYIVSFGISALVCFCVL